MKMRLLFLVCSLSHSVLTHAQDLMDVYQDALQNDTIFKAAYNSYLSTGESIPEALAALLPQVTLGANAGRNKVHAEAGPAFSIDAIFNSNQWQVNASQAVFNYQAWTKVKQAKASTKAAQANFNSEAQSLILRTARAYFDVLFAEDTLSYAEAKKRANKRQLEQAEARFKVGLEPITSVYEARAGYDQSIAEVITTKNNLINQNENIRKITNHVYDWLAPLRDSRVPLIRPEPNNVDEWVDTGVRQNYSLYNARYNLEAARQNIRVQSSGAMPVFSLQGNASQLHNDLNSFSPFVATQETIYNMAVAVNIPVLQGGLVEAETRQAKYDFQVISEKLERTYRDVVVNTRIAYNNIVDGISKVEADRQTVVSRVNSLESTEAQYRVGTRTMVDVVNAQQRLFESQTQLAKDQYDFIYSLLYLKDLAGTLNVNDLQEINAWLKTTRLTGFAP